MMFYIIKDGLFFAGYQYASLGIIKEKWDENLCLFFKTKEEVDEVHKTIGGEIKTFTAT